MSTATLSDTSRAAHESVSNRAALYTAIKSILSSSSQPHSDEQIAFMMGVRFPDLEFTPSGLRTRRSELTDKAYGTEHENIRKPVIDSGLTGKTKTGRKTTLWKLKR